MRDDIIEKLTVLAELHNQEQFTLSLDYFVKLNNVWMPNFLKNFNLPTNSFDVLFVFNPGLFKYFNCDL